MVASTGTCFPYIINNGQLFALQNVYSKMFLSARQDPNLQLTPAIQEDTLPSDPNVQFISSLTNLYNPHTNLCLDDLGHGYSSTDSTDNYLAFRDCIQYYSQQFTHSPICSVILFCM